MEALLAVVGIHNPGFRTPRGQLARAAALLMALCLPGGLAAGEPPKPPHFTHGVLIRFEGPITPGLERYLGRKLAVAKEQGADLVILEIESPGGLLAESLRIAEQMRDLPVTRTAAYIPRQALSGAAIVALGCDEILMAPTARLGDAGPIVLGQDALFRFAPQKIVSDLAVQMRNLAKAKGRPPALAEAMVDRDLVVWRAREIKTGKLRYVSQREIDEDPDRWKKLGTVQGTGGRFLEVTGTDALELGLAQGIISDRQQLAGHFGLDSLEVLEPSATDTAIDVLNSWWMTGLLLVLGLVGLYTEFTMPGTAAGGLLAAVAFTLLFWSHILGGTAGWLQVVLFLLGIACMAVELFVVPGSMVAGLLGVALILVSLIMVTQGFLVPETRGQVRVLAGTLAMIFAVLTVFTLAAVFISRRFGTLPLFSRLMLAPPESAAPKGPGGADAGAAEAALGVRVGEVGIAHSLLRPGGKARFGQRWLDVLTDGDFIPRGSRVRVVRIQDNQIVVAQIEPQEPPAR
jgi:membrane-bound serine protease (ClpP class)